jgi:2-keto-4-pentenoate hydratase
MSTQSAPGEAAHRIWAAWRDGRKLDGLPEGCRPADLDAAYAAQAELDTLGGERIGWKLAATGAGGRAALGVDQPLVGPLYKRFAVPDGGELSFGSVRMKTVEGEFGFVMAADLPPREAPYERADVLAALGAFVPAIEVPDTRYLDHRAAGGPQLVADAACAGTYVIGTPVSDYDPQALRTHETTLRVAGGEPIVGRGDKVLGDPVEAVRYLAEHLRTHERTLRAGDIIITGAATAAKDPTLGEVQADFGTLGRVTLTLTP